MVLSLSLAVSGGVQGVLTCLGSYVGCCRLFSSGVQGAVVKSHGPQLRSSSLPEVSRLTQEQETREATLVKDLDRRLTALQDKQLEDLRGVREESAWREPS